MDLGPDQDPGCGREHGGPGLNSDITTLLCCSRDVGGSGDGTGDETGAWQGQNCTSRAQEAARGLEPRLPGDQQVSGREPRLCGAGFRTRTGAQLLGPGRGPPWSSFTSKWEHESRPGEEASHHPWVHGVDSQVRSGGWRTTHVFSGDPSGNRKDKQKATLWGVAGIQAGNGHLLGWGRAW